MDDAPSEPITVEVAVLDAAESIEEAGVGDSARLDAELIVGHVCDLDRVGLRVHGDRTLDASQERAIDRLVGRRMTGEPVAYLLGTAWFYGRQFEVDARVLVPRPETELLVEIALSHFVEHASSGVFIDVCTGSGCIGVSIAAELGPRAVVRATDVSSDALDVARANARRHGVEVDFRLGDLLQPIREDETAAVIVANPPYVEGAMAEGLEANVRDNEPHVALFVPPEGVSALYRRLATEAVRRLDPGGMLAVEHGAGQRAVVTAAMHAAGLVDIEGRDDLAGIDRVVVGVRDGERR